MMAVMKDGMGSAFGIEWAIVQAQMDAGCQVQWAGDKARVDFDVGACHVLVQECPNGGYFIEASYQAGADSGESLALMHALSEKRIGRDVESRSDGIEVGGVNDANELRKALYVILSQNKKPVKR